MHVGTYATIQITVTDSNTGLEVTRTPNTADEAILFKQSCGVPNEHDEAIVKQSYYTPDEVCELHKDGQMRPLGPLVAPE